MSPDKTPREACCAPPVGLSAPPPDLAVRAKLFKALADEVRLTVLHYVSDQELCVCDLMELLEMPQGTLSHHLSVLHQAGLVSSRKQGRWNYYQATALARAPLQVLDRPGSLTS